MIQIKLLNYQTYEELNDKPSELVFLYENESLEKQLVRILSLHFAEKIKEMIEYLQEISKIDFTNCEVIIFTTEKRNIALIKNLV